MIDTSALLHILKETETGIKIAEKYAKEFNSISSIIVHEIMAGANPKNKSELMNFLRSFEIITFENGFKSVEIYEKLKSKGKMIGLSDIFIASICMEHGLKLVTIDKDFKNIERLNVEMY